MIFLFIASHILCMHCLFLATLQFRLSVFNIGGYSLQLQYPEKTESILLDVPL